MRQAEPRRHGLTLIELLTTIVIISLLSSGGALLLVEGVEAWNQFTVRIDTGRQARLGMDWMSREIREVDVDSDGNAVISTADTQTFAFTHTLTSTTTEAVTYSWDGTAGSPLLRNSDTLVPQVTALTFAYYDANDAALSPLPLTAAQRLDVRRVVITCTVRNPMYTAHTMKVKGEALLRSVR